MVQTLLIDRPYVTDGFPLGSSADSGRVPFQLEPVRLDILVGEVVESFSERANALGVRLEMAPSPSVLISGDCALSRRHPARKSS